jgi:hypothetical protein
VVQGLVASRKRRRELAATLKDAIDPQLVRIELRTAEDLAADNKALVASTAPRQRRTSAAPLLGSRPRPPAKQPPFRPDVRCTSQDMPKLDASAAPPAAAPRHVTPRAATGPKVEKLANLLARRAGR